MSWTLEDSLARVRLVMRTAGGQTLTADEFEQLVLASVEAELKTAVRHTMAVSKEAAHKAVLETLRETLGSNA